jgi:hypothetical protein
VEEDVTDSVGAEKARELLILGFGVMYGNPVVASP